MNIETKRELYAIIEHYKRITPQNPNSDVATLPNHVMSAVNGHADDLEEYLQTLADNPDHDLELAHAFVDELLHGEVPSGVYSIMGSGGTGKTTLIKSIIEKADIADVPINVTATSNTAVNVLMSRGIDDVKTVKKAYSALEWGEDYKHAVAYMVCLHWKADDSDVADNMLKHETLRKRAETRAMAAKVMPEFKQIFDEAPANIRTWANQLTLEGKADEAFLILKVDALKMFEHYWSSRNSSKAEVVIVDEAGMMGSDDLEKIQAKSDTVLLMGDNCQLGAIIAPKDEGHIVPAFQTVPFANQVHLSTCRRANDGTDHFDYADEVLKLDYNAGQLMQFLTQANSIEVADKYDATLAMRSPIITYLNASRHAASLLLRDGLDLPTNALASGERLIVDNIERSHAPYWNDKGITKGSILRVIKQDNPYVVTISHNGVIIPDANMLVRVNAQELQKTRIKTLAPQFLENGIQLSLGTGLLCSPAGAITCHKAQGKTYDERVQISWGDFAWFARSFGREDGEDLPGVPMARRWLYTALTRSRKGVILVRNQNISYSNDPVNTLFHNFPTDAGLTDDFTENELRAFNET